MPKSQIGIVAVSNRNDFELADRWTAQKNGMPTKCLKHVEKCPNNDQRLSRRGRKQNFRTFLDNFCLFGRCFSLVTLSNARPLQCNDFEIAERQRNRNQNRL